MIDWIWLNGKIMPMSEARIGVEDRGFQFGDGVYEVIRLYAGKPFALGPHLDRLERSAGGIQLGLPLAKEQLASEIEGLISRIALGEGMIYLQLTRGVSPRNHQFSPSEPTLLFYGRELPAILPPGAGPGVSLLTVADERWNKCWIKSIALLANVLAKNAAIAAGADEAAFVENGNVNECSASNLFFVFGQRVATVPVGAKVLGGITRAVLIEAARKIGIGAEERSISRAEAMGASEIFITSTTREISWVRSWDGHTISEKIGPMTLRLHHELSAHIRASR